jgi:phage terminase large subunit GpA-like protein
VDFEQAMRDVCSGFEALRPPGRMPVSLGAARNLVISRPGGGSGPYSLAETPYMVEPMDMLGSRRHVGVVYVGGSQQGKTAALGEGWLAHAVVNDPGDFLIVQMTQDKAREYSKQRIDRAIKHSPNIYKLRGPSSRDDNLHDKQFKHGMWLRIAWPTVGNLSSTSYRYVFITDYDRIDDNIDGEGDAWGLGSARTRTFMSRGMICAESSPGRPITDPNWKPVTPHEAPPCKGILGLYNRGDLRRWYWKCPHCYDHFEAKPGMSLFRLPSDEELIRDIRKINISKMAAQYARVVCPTCGSEIDEEWKGRMNASGLWVPEGGQIVGHEVDTTHARQTSIASFWLGGVAAAYNTWPDMIRKQLQAILDYANTGEEKSWQTTVNTDQGMPYTPRALLDRRTASGPEDRKEDDLKQFVCPEQTRCVLASVDVQGGKNARFIVQASAIGEGGEEWPIDRYTIIDSRRPREGGGFHAVEPAIYPEDWDVLTERVLRSTYRIAGSDREIRVHLTAVDTGGENRKASNGGKTNEGVTMNAYAWLRRLRAEGMHNRVRLIKGVGTDAEWPFRETMVGNKTGRADVPLYLLNSNLLKDSFDGALRRTDPGPGFIHIPAWWPAAMFEELHAEVRNKDGTWTQIRARNEAFDLGYYIRFLKVATGLDKPRFWEKPPGWALPIDRNTEVITREQRVAMRDNELVGYIEPSATPPEPKKLKRRSGMATGL